MAAAAVSASASLSMSMAAAGQLPVPRAVKAPALSLSLWTRPLRANVCKCKCRCLVIGGGIARARKFGAGFAVFAQDSALAADAIEDQGIASELTPNEEAGESFQGSFDAFQAHDDEGAEFSQEFSSPPPDTRLYVGNIPFEIDSEGLANLFQEAGVVETAEVIYDRATGRSKGFGFVSMSTAEEAKEAINKFNGSQVSGRVLKVNISEVRKGVRRPAPIFGVDTAFKVFVGNLPWSADADMLKEAFNRCGNVVGAKVLYDRDTGRSRGFGFVSFSSQAEVDSAVTEMNGVDVGGRPIRVDIPRSAITPVSGPDSESPASGPEDS